MSGICHDIPDSASPLSFLYPEIFFLELLCLRDLASGRRWKMYVQTCKKRHQQDSNLRPQRGTDVYFIRICRRNHLAIVPMRTQHQFYNIIAMCHHNLPKVFTPYKSPALLMRHSTCCLFEYYIDFFISREQSLRLCAVCAVSLISQEQHGFQTVGRVPERVVLEKKHPTSHDDYTFSSLPSIDH